MDNIVALTYSITMGCTKNFKMIYFSEENWELLLNNKMTVHSMYQQI